MTSALLVDVVYVGSKNYKEDNICKTGAVWFGHGDVQKIERKYVPILLKHPDVWMLKTEFDAKFGGQNIFGNQNLIAAVINPPGFGLNESHGSLVHTAQSFAQAAIESTPEIGFRHPDSAPNVAQSAEAHTSDDSGVTKDSAGEPAGGASNESANSESGVPTASIEEIKGAIILLEAEPDNKEWWTDIGRPKTDAVRNMLGKKVSVKDLNAAWSSMGRE